MKKTKSFLALALCFCMILGLPALPNVFDGISLVTTAEAAEPKVKSKSRKNRKIFLGGGKMG